MKRQKNREEREREREGKVKEGERKREGRRERGVFPAGLTHVIPAVREAELGIARDAGDTMGFLDT